MAKQSFFNPDNSLYQKLSTAVLGMAGRSRFKLLAEQAYWRYALWKEGQFNNNHYEYFFTQHFGLDLNFFKGKTVVDLGCGPRGSLEWLAPHADCIGIDPLAKQYLAMQQAPLQMQMLEGVGENIPLPSASVDVLSTFNSLDHVDDLSATLAEIYRVLKPGGTLLVIADIHQHPTICEPSAFSWDIVDRLKQHYFLKQVRSYEGGGTYSAIRAAVPFDFNNKKERYGVLSLMGEKGYNF